MNAITESYCNLIQDAHKIRDLLDDPFVHLRDDRLSTIVNILYIKQLSEDGQWFRIILHPIEFGWLPVDPKNDPQIMRGDIKEGDTALPSLSDFKRYESWVDHIVIGLNYPKDFTDETF